MQNSVQSYTARGLDCTTMSTVSKPMGNGLHTVARGDPSNNSVNCVLECTTIGFEVLALCSFSSLCA